ncbi:hypothetical protein LJR168_003915 [Pseudoxanthomonas sp. LjRoot168]|uniref:hypothetical protein n=1 Tax=unclassified Pseudoxanthomonas TaxID=2645906 RepID=UPI003ECCA4D5
MTKLEGGVIALVVAVLVGTYPFLIWSESKKDVIRGERLDLVWPEASVDDRTLLEGLAYSCGLSHVEPRQEAVEQCLRRATRMDKASLPSGVTKEQAVARLEALIASAAVPR